jgi:hypothetical protein
MYTNELVVRAFYNREPARSRNLVSNGVSLHSYEWWEIARWIDDEVVLRNGPSYSVSTARHRSLCKGDRLSQDITLVGSGEMKLR